MRGNLWTLLAVAVVGGILLRAVNVAYPSNPTSSTIAVSGTLDSVAPFLGLALTLVAVGALWSITASRGF